MSHVHPPPHHLHPLDVVLGLLADELDALQHVGDVVDTTFLDLQHLGRAVEIHDAVGRLAQQTDKFFGEQPQRGVVASLLPGRLGGCGKTRDTPPILSLAWAMG